MVPGESLEEGVAMPLPSGDLSHVLTAPATSEFIGTARLFIGAVGAAAGGDESLVDDLKLAVSEVFTAIVEHGSADAVRVTATPSAGGLTVQITPWPHDGLPAEFGALDIVDALFPGVSAGDGEVVVPVEIEAHA